MKRSRTVAVNLVDVDSLMPEQRSYDFSVAIPGRVMKGSPIISVRMVGVDAASPLEARVANAEVAEAAAVHAHSLLQSST